MNEEQQDVERWDVTIYDGSPTTELAENGEYVLYEAYEQLKAQLAHEKFLRDTTQVSGGGDAVAVLRDVIDYAESGKVPEPSWIPRIEAIIAALSTPQARPDDGAVAWMADDGSTVSEYARAAHPSPTAFAEYTTPLYTHPAPAPDVARLVSMWRDRGLRGTKIGDAIHACADELEEAIAALNLEPNP